MGKKLKPDLKRTPNDLEKLHPDLSGKGEREMCTLRMGVFCKNLGITHSL